MGVMEHFLLLVPGPLPGCIFMRHIILALFTVYGTRSLKPYAAECWGLYSLAVRYQKLEALCCGILEPVYSLALRYQKLEALCCGMLGPV
jgi:hypothetical protein